MWMLFDAIFQFFEGRHPNLPDGAGRKGPVDDRDLWYFEQDWVAQEAEAEADLQRARYLDFADTASLVIVLQSPPGAPHSQPFFNAIRQEQNKTKEQ